MTNPLRRIGAFTLIALLWGCDAGEPGELPEERAPVSVRVSTPVRAAATVTAAGHVVSAAEAELATRTSGRIVAVPVDVGSRVAAGQPLVRLDDSGVEARVAAARAALVRARKSHERIRNLERDGAATAQELDDARAALETAEAGMEEAVAQREYVVLRAPFAGRISMRSVDPGDLASPGVPVLGLLSPDSLQIVADLPAEAARGLETGDRATVREPGTDRSWEARVTWVSPARDPASRRVRVELVPVPEPGRALSLMPGAFVTVERPSADEPTLWIPSDAIVRRGQLTGVYLVRDGRLDLRWVRLGASDRDAREVLAGLAPPDSVVRTPGPGVRDGSPVADVSVESWSPAREGGS